LRRPPARGFVPTASRYFEAGKPRIIMIIVDPQRPAGIIWIASYPKSGNTWVRAFLHNLMLIQNGTSLDDNDLAQLADNSSSEASLIRIFEFLLGKKVTEATPDEITEVRPKVQAVVKDRTPSVALLKTHNMLALISGQPLINRAVSAGAVYVVRNPLDIVLSLQDHLGATIAEAILAMESDNFASLTEPRQVFELWGSWSQHVASWTMEKSDPVLVVRYEDMLEKPTETFRSIADHLRQPITDAVLAQAIERSSFKRLKEQEEAVGFREKTPRGSAFFRVGREGLWRDGLSEDDIGRIVGTHHVQMRRFGYITEELERYVPAAVKATGTR
jgi:hypothetical protein